MPNEQSAQDPLFVMITEAPDTVDAPDELRAAPLHIKVGDTLPISGRDYVVDNVRAPGGAFAVRNKKDDLRGNLAAFELLRGSGALPPDCEIDGLCLRNRTNGDCLVELCHDGAASGAGDPAAQPSKHHFFARLDAEIVNPHLQADDFDGIVVRASPCMFGATKALLVTSTGRPVRLIERSAVVDEPIDRVVVDRKLSVYEREILRRILAVIALLVRGGKVTRVVTALPRGAYYSFLIAGAARGLISPQTMLAWFDAVDERVALLRERFVRDLGVIAPSLAVEQYSFMDSACDALRGFFRGRLDRGAEPFDVDALLAEVIQAMQAADPFARYVFEAGALKPTSFRDLADLAYAVSNLVDMAEPAPGRLLVIGVYDPTENIMWYEARKVRYRGLLLPRGLYRPEGPARSTLDSLSYVGIMPLQQVIFGVSQQYMERHLGGAGRLWALHTSALDSVDKHLVTGIFSRLDPGRASSP